MGAMIDLWRGERQARPFFAAITQGALAQGAGYVAVMLSPTSAWARRGPRA